MSVKRWKKRGRRLIYRFRRIEVREDTVLLPTGKRVPYLYVHPPSSVMIVALTPRGTIPMIRQYRYPTDNLNFELPGGSAGAHGIGRRRLLRAAQNELEEETGYVARRWKWLGRFVVYSGLSSEFSNVFLAWDTEKREQKLEETEFIEVVEVPARSLDRWISGPRARIRDGMSLAALAMARREIARRIKRQKRSP